MSKRARTKGSGTVVRRMNEGRGKGRGASYQPWIKIHDLGSRGLSARMKSLLNGRTHHLLSKLESDWVHAFYALPGLVDLREQVPLDLEETTVIAQQLGIRHPTDPRTQELCVVTTDVVLTCADGSTKVETAVAIKQSADLASRRNLEKLEIERVFWSARKIRWLVLTEQELPHALVKNMKWLKRHLDLPESGEVSKELIVRIRAVMEPIIKQGNSSLVEVTTRCDDHLGLPPGRALCVARHLIGSGEWPIDLSVEIEPQKPLHLISKQSKCEIAA